MQVQFCAQAAVQLHDVGGDRGGVPVPAGGRGRGGGARARAAAGRHRGVRALSAGHHLRQPPVHLALAAGRRKTLPDLRISNVLHFPFNLYSKCHLFYRQDIFVNSVILVIT